MAAIVAPSGFLSRARTASCLVPPRVEPVKLLPGFFAPLLAREGFVLLGVLRCDIFGSLSVATARAPSLPKPRSGGGAGGAGSPGRAQGLSPFRHRGAPVLPK